MLSASPMRCVSIIMQHNVYIYYNSKRLVQPEKFGAVFSVKFGYRFLFSLIIANADFVMLLDCLMFSLLVRLLQCLLIFHDVGGLKERPRLWIQRKLVVGDENDFKKGLVFCSNPLLIE